MAKYNLENYLEKDGLGFPLNFRRGNPNPLDNSSVWKSLELAKNYAETDPTAYVGQILSVVDYTPAVTDEEGNVTTASHSTVNVYYIKDEAGNLELVGTSPVGDESTITVAEDGTVSLYGIEGLELTRTEDDGQTVNITYQPLYTNGKLTWVEPSATTVEGLATEIEGLKTRTSSLETTIGKAAEGETPATGLVKSIADLQTKDTEIENSVTAINDKIGNITEGKTVVEMIEDAQSAATYDDTDLVNRVKAIEDDYLVATDKTELQGNIDKKADKTEVETLAGRVDTVENDIATLNGNDTVEGSVDKKIADAFNEFITTETADEVVNTYKELINYAENHGSEATEMASAISTLEGEMDTAQADIIDLKTKTANNATTIAEVKSLVGETSVESQIEAAIEAENLDQYATDEELTTLANRVKVVEDDHLVATDKTELNDLITANTNKLTEIENDYKAVDEAINASLNEKAAQTDLDNAVERISDLESVGAEKNFIASVDETQFNVDDNRNLTLLDVAMSKVTGLPDALAGKVDKVEGSRLITESEASKIEKLVLGDDGSVTVSGTIAAGNVDGLADWITARAGSLKGLSENNLTDALVEKLNSIDTSAQTNIIEIVSINNEALTVSNKTVNIPLATAEKLGVVKSSDDENKIAVGSDGTMEVNNINVNKLVQTDGDSLILNGGSATA